MWMFSIYLWSLLYRISLKNHNGVVFLFFRALKRWSVKTLHGRRLHPGKLWSQRSEVLFLWPGWALSQISHAIKILWIRFPCSHRVKSLRRMWLRFLWSLIRLKTLRIKWHISCLAKRIKNLNLDFYFLPMEKTFTKSVLYQSALKQYLKPTSSSKEKRILCIERLSHITCTLLWPLFLEQ